jgi:hypothetical protein
MMAKISDYFAVRVMNAFYSLATINDSVHFWYGSSLTRGMLEDAIDSIADIAGQVRVVVGRRTALAPITKFAGYRAGVGATESTAPIVPDVDALRTIRDTGWFGKYYGADFMSLTQVYDNPYDRNKLIQDNLIVVVGNAAGEFITYGPPKQDQWTDMSTAPPTWHLRVYQQYGMILDNVQNIGILRIDKP